MTQVNLGIQLEDPALERYGANEAKMLIIKGQSGARVIRKRLLWQLNVIDGMAVKAAEWCRNQQSIPQEFEWLLDNRYLLEREGKQAALSLRGAGRLPLDSASNRLAAYAAMRSLARVTRGEVTLARLRLFLKGFQSEHAMTEKELSLLIPLLKAALIDAAASVCLEMREILWGFRQDPRTNSYAAERSILHALSQGSAPPPGAEDLAAEAKAKHSALSTQLGNVVTTLRMLASADVGPLLQEASVVEQLLCSDPGGHYTGMSEETRMAYRQELSRLSMRRGMSELSAAKQVLAMAAEQHGGTAGHVGHFIFNQPLGADPSKLPGRLYFTSMALLVLAGTGLTAALTGLWPGALLSAVPIFDIAKYLCDFAAARLKKPDFIPRMEYAGGLPEEGKTLCVITAVLSRTGQARALSQKLEQYYLSNRDAGPHMRYGLLCDLRDAANKLEPGDEEILSSAHREITSLNHKYGGGFFLLTRERVFCKGEGRYMGWERKRGALTELMRCLRGKPCGLRVSAGDSSMLSGVRFVVTLDADTQLSAGTLRPLVGAMLHPLNTPEIDPATRTVVRGHGLLQPRMAVALAAANASRFTRLYAGQGGLDPYNGNVSDVYQDIFGRGVFVGKGIMNVDAYLSCVDNRFPERRILSHDLLEGSYLRAGFAGDIEWSDGHPAHIAAWLERSHRWIRGDWQIAAWVGGITPSVPRDGKRRAYERNPLSALPRFQIFDNLRRSLTPPVLLACLSLAVLYPGAGYLAPAIAALLDLGCHLLVSSGQLASRGRQGGRRYHSTIITGPKAALYQCVSQLWLLALQTFSNLHAVLVSLWRLYLSKRHLLSWRTADESERRAVQGTGVLAASMDYVRRCWASMLWGALIILTAVPAAGRVLGALWLTAPFFAALISRPSRSRPGLTNAQRSQLRQHASAIWRYFEDFVTQADNYLPPDNWQEQPGAGLARRTSPTNIGLALLSAFAALDMELIDSEHALHFIDRMVTSIERLPKWHGHLYNWYDTATLKPLRPMCVSTVDSGNLAGYLVALREGLSELNDAAAEDLAARVHCLYEAMDFRPLYDSRRRLFYIGYDLELDRTTDSYYDLLASEARQASYIAIARGQVPRNHWRRLGRVLAAHNRYSGMTSWTGTMFEYFMPHLLMPCPENSLLYESLRFAVYCQIQRADERGLPWGISESCFFAFDGALNYQYKAHGEPRLAYKRGLGQELVISPYSTYLALPMAANAALKNLKTLQEMGLEGRYGLCEAADFTPTRLTGGRDFMQVRCFMAHHLGMSLLAIDNALNSGIMQRRFMRDPEMGAFRELLEERVPVGGVTMRPRGQEVPEKPARSAVTGWKRELEGIDLYQPRCTMLSNAAYTLFCTDAGLTASHSGGLELTRFKPDQTQWGLGWQFLLKKGDIWTGLTAAPLMSGTAKHSAVFDLNSVCWEMRADDQSIRTSLVARVPRDEHGELRRATIYNTGKEPLELELYAYMEPVLADAGDYDSHPAFSKLFLQSGRTGQNVRFTRRSRDGSGDTHMVVSCDALEAEFGTSRETALPRGGASAFTLGPVADGMVGYVLDPCVLIKVPVKLNPGDSREIRFSLAVAATASDAESAAVRTLRLGDDAESAGLDGPMRLLGLSQAETHAALDWLSDVVFITGNRTRQSFDSEHSAGGQQVLWQWGVSGDLPIVVATGADAQPERLARLLRQYRFLSLIGARFDFVIHTQDGSDYRRPQRAYIMEALKAMGCEGVLGVKGGVHIVDASAAAQGDIHLLMSAASLVLDGWKNERTARPEAESPQDSLAMLKPVTAFKRGGRRPLKIATRRLDDGAFQFDTGGGSLPETAWSHTLANQAFGCLVRDGGLGHVWRYNARENKLTPWDNDPRALQSGETMWLDVDGVRLSPFADHDGCPCTVTYGLGYAKYEKKYREVVISTTIFVPPDRMARIILLKVEGAGSAVLHHCAELIMGVSPSGRRHIVTAWDGENNCLTAKNSYNTAYGPQWAVLRSNPAPLGFSCDKTAWREGRVGGQCGAGLDPCFGETVGLQPRQGGLEAVIVLGAAQNKPGLERVCELSDFDRALSELERTKRRWSQLARPIKVRTASRALDNYLNGWALYQVIATRMFARASTYQCGGAYGFRDQLQDACAAVYSDPALLRVQILRACSHQFEEGDVQHWWHPAGRAEKGLSRSDKGVRTRCSDDLLWLPYAVCEYLEKTGDAGILEISVPYITAPGLEPGQHDRFDVPGVSSIRETVYRHCERALECVLTRGTGRHGLLLIGGGDWNDGFDKVGAEGMGESTWLTWFAAHVLSRFADLSDTYGTKGTSSVYRSAARGLVFSADSAWDGNWYLRGYYDDGSPLGGAQCDECKIDSIAQSFALWADGAAPERVSRALDSAWEHLVDSGNMLIRLYTPPFDKTGKNPGYIKGYLPGVRENGGQYTHAAIWFALAQLMDGRTDAGLELLEMLLPENHPQKVYKAEPHVLAADVYTCPGHAGRGGWSHYTGAAGWYYRVAVEHLLGIKLRDGAYRLEQTLPPVWDGMPPVITTPPDKTNQAATCN